MKTQHVRIVFCLGYLIGCCSVTMFCVEAKIVFVESKDIWVMNDDGTGRHRLTDNITVKDRHPRWSPDGTKIAFTRYMDKAHDTSSEIFIMNADKSDPQRLTDNNAIDGYPSWSPDGHRLVFRSNRSGRWAVFVMDIATRAVTLLAEGATSPDWSPDGTQIVFEDFLNRGNGIAPKKLGVVDADGEHRRSLLPDPPLGGPPKFIFQPRWSADGQRILFSESEWLEDRDLVKLYVYRTRGVKKEIKDINDRIGNEWLGAGHCWMWNDQAILFSIERLDKPNPNYDIYRYTFNTRSLRRLTHEPENQGYPDWTEGVLSVSPNQKLPTQWGDIKQSVYID